jgi:hypothetical protein
MQNAGLRLMRHEFRTFAHPPSAMLAVCRAEGLSVTDAHAGVVWQVKGLSRSPKAERCRRVDAHRRSTVATQPRAGPQHPELGPKRTESVGYRAVFADLHPSCGA